MHRVGPHLALQRRPGLDGFRNTISLDQVAANHLGYVTRFPSIVLGTATAQSQSYTTSGAMVPAETSPANLFRRLFLQGTPEEVEREAQSLNDGGSILDRLKSQTSALRRRVSATDQRKLDAYFEAVRTAEAELGEVKAWQQRPKPVVDTEQPARKQVRTRSEQPLEVTASEPQSRLVLADVHLVEHGCCSFLSVV